MLLFCSSAYSELSLNGSAILKDLGKQQFVAGLFVDTLHNNANTVQLEDAPKHMRILNNYSKRRWINLWMQIISINNDRESFSGSAQEVIDIMQAPKSAPQKGDIIEYIYHPKQGTSMRFNGTELVSNYPKNVFNMLLRTRISPIPPSTTFKHQLLGLVSADEAKNLLSSVEPTNRRIALAASWVAEPAKVEPIAEPMVAEAVVKPAPEVVATAGALALISAVEKTEVEVQAAAKAAEQAKEEELVLNVAETLTQRHYAPLVVGQIYKSLTLSLIHI